MTRDDIIRLMGWPDKSDPVSDLLDRVECVVLLAVAAERAACAAICEGYYDTHYAARAIRARGGE